MAASSGARLQRKAARTAGSAVSAHSFRRCYGLPFASPNGLYNLSRLSVFWLRLGIALERIAPGKPMQNGFCESLTAGCVMSS